MGYIGKLLNHFGMHMSTFAIDSIATLGIIKQLRNAHCQWMVQELYNLMCIVHEHLTLQSRFTSTWMMGQRDTTYDTNMAITTQHIGKHPK